MGPSLSVVSERAPRLVRWTFWRRAVQIVILIFYLALPVFHVLGFRALAGNLASLKIGPIDLVEPAAGLSAAVAGRQLGWTLLLGLFPVVLLALVLGPVFCSWICPWGLVSELLDRWVRRGRRRTWPIDRWRLSRWPRLVTILGLLAASAVLASPLLAVVSAPRLLTHLPLEVIYLRVLSPVTGSLLLALLAIELLGPRRVWCRTLCPVGTVAKVLRTPRTVAVRFDETRCLCPTVAQCQNRCPWGIDPRRMSTFDGCTNCLACVEVCPSASLGTGWGLK